jgi:hypothetical protein
MSGVGGGGFVAIQFDQLLRDSGHSVLLEIGGEQIWVPKSVIEEDIDEEQGIVHISRAWANSKGLL